MVYFSGLIVGVGLGVRIALNYLGARYGLGADRRNEQQGPA